MGIYYGVKSILINGEKIGLATDKQPTIENDSVLVGMMYCNDWAIAPDVTKNHDYQRFFDDYVDGIFKMMELYTITKDQIKDCPDEGRVLVKELLFI